MSTSSLPSAFERMLAKIKRDKVLQEIYDDIDKKAALGLTTALFEIEDSYVAELCVQELRLCENIVSVHGYDNSKDISSFIHVEFISEDDE